MRRGSVRHELRAIGLLLLVVLPLAAVFLAVRPDGNFYQQYFASAVMLSCGEGYVDVREPDQPAELDRFLNRKTRSMDCSAVRDVKSAEPTDFQYGARWLLTGAAALWWLTGGPSWDALLPLALALLALSTIAAYGLLRLVARPAVAAPLAAVAVLWPYHLFMVRHMRDYSKAPWIWLGCLGIAVGVLGTTLRTRMIAAALGGVAVGIGFGFRSDLLILVPLGVCALLLQPWEGRRRLWTGPAVAAGFVACFAIAAAPILPSYGDGSNNAGIVAVEGLTPEHNERIGLESELYLTSYHYNDLYTAGLAAAHGRFVNHEPGPYTWGSTPFDVAANETFSEQSRYLPADTLLRTGLAALASLRLGTVPPLGSLLVGLPILVAAAVLLGARRPRALALALILVLPLAGVTALQWQVRHAFHVAIVAFLVLAAAIEMYLSRPVRLPRRRSLALSAGVLAAGAAVALTVYAVTVVIQDSRVDDYLAQLERQPRSPVPGRAEASGGRVVLPLTKDYVKTWDGVSGNRSAYLRVVAGPCEADTASLTLQYNAPTTYLDYSQTLQVDPRAGAEWYVVAPVIVQTRPIALRLEGAPACPLRAERVEPRDLPLLLNVLRDARTAGAPRRATPDARLLLLGWPMTVTS